MERGDLHESLSKKKKGKGVRLKKGNKRRATPSARPCEGGREEGSFYSLGRDRERENGRHFISTLPAACERGGGRGG